MSNVKIRPFCPRERQLLVRIPSIDDLVTNTRASGRTKDLADAEALEELKDSEQNNAG